MAQAPLKWMKGVQGPLNWDGICPWELFIVLCDWIGQDWNLMAESTGDRAIFLQTFMHGSTFKLMLLSKHLFAKLEGLAYGRHMLFCHGIVVHSTWTPKESISSGQQLLTKGHHPCWAHSLGCTCLHWQASATRLGNLHSGKSFVNGFGFQVSTWQSTTQYYNTSRPKDKDEDEKRSSLLRCIVCSMGSPRQQGDQIK